MGMVSPDHEQMHFSPPVQLRSDTERSLISHLQNSGRMRDVTLPILIRLGAKAFCWVHPNEDINGDESGGVLTAYGAFLYTFSDGSDPVFFHLVNPEAVHNAAEAVQASRTQLLTSEGTAAAMVTSASAVTQTPPPLPPSPLPA